MNPFPASFFLLAGALLLAALAVPPIRRLAWRVDLVDPPREGGHKSHERPIAYGGGVAIWLGTIIPAFLVLLHASRQPDAATFPGDPRPFLTLLAGATVLLAVGLVDDWRSLPPLPRFLVQLAVTGTLVITCPSFRLPLFGNSPLVVVPLTVLWIAALTNAFNFLDNMDGLSAGIAGIVLLLLAGLGLAADHPSGALLCLIIVGATAGFLIHNFPPASIFMGDAGGLFLGFLISSASVLLSNHLGQVHAGLPHRLAPLLVLAVPVYDLISVSLIRLKNGVPPWIGDKNHISHRLVRQGLSRRRAVLIIYAATLLAGLPALFILRAPGRTSWLLLLLVPAAAILVALADFAAQRRQGRTA